MELSAEKGRIKRKGEVSLRQKGSLTVEYALILPLFSWQWWSLPGCWIYTDFRYEYKRR